MARIVFDIDIDAPASKILDALNTQEGIASWWTDGIQFPGGVGSEMELSFPVAPMPFRLRVDEDGPDTVRWSNTGEFPPHWKDTTVTWALTPNKAGGTSVRFEHDGWPNDEGGFGMAALTWAQLQLTLKEHVETGQSVPLFTNRTRHAGDSRAR